jgi:hypothetical protein
MRRGSGGAGFAGGGAGISMKVVGRGALNPNGIQELAVDRANNPVENAGVINQRGGFIQQMAE